MKHKNINDEKLKKKVQNVNKENELAETHNPIDLPLWFWVSAVYAIYTIIYALC